MLISLTELFSQSFEKYSKHFAKTFPYLAIILASLLLRYGVGYLGVELAYTRLSNFLSDLIVLILLIIVFILGFWGTVAFTKVAQNLDKNQPLLPFKQQFLNIKKYLIPVFLVSFISIFLIALGGILLVIPGVIFFVWYYFSNYIVIFEDQKVFASLTDSKKLIVGRWWAMAWRITVPKVIFSLLSGLAGKAILALFVVIVSPSPIIYDLAFEFIVGLVSILMLPLFVWQDITLYYSAKENLPQLATPTQK